MQQDKPSAAPKPAPDEDAPAAGPSEDRQAQAPSGVDGNEQSDPGERPGPVAPEGEAGDVDSLAALQAEVARLEQELASMRDQALRALAEAENTRRRAEREKRDAVKYAALPLLRDVVKAADNLARALEAAGEEKPDETATAKALREGVALTEKELLSAFTRHGVTRIDPKGEPLNPEQHEAMMEMPDETAEPGTVAQVLEPGWLLHDRLIRPARVAVARKP